MNQSRSPDPLFVAARRGARGPSNAASNVEPNNSSNRSMSSNQGMAARAEKFEDEKQRIIESLFSKRDDDGSHVENYITHVRVRREPWFNPRGI